MFSSIWHEGSFVGGIFDLFSVSCLSFLPSEVGAPNCGQFLLGQVRGYFWSIAPRRNGVNLAFAPYS